MKLLKIEDTLINTLTSIVWWFEVRFNEGVKNVFIFFAFGFPTFVALIYTTLIFSNTSKSVNLTFFVALGSGAIFGMLVFIVVVLFVRSHDKNIMSNTKQKPNPNRENTWIEFCRFTLNSWFVIFVIKLYLYFSDIHKNEVADLDYYLFGILIHFFIMCAFYTLCVDPIPTEEKMRRIKNNQTS